MSDTHDTTQVNAVERLAEALSITLYRVVPAEQMSLALRAVLVQEGLAVVPSKPDGEGGA